MIGYKSNSLRTINRRKANWIGHILRRNCLLKNKLKERYKEQKDGEEDVRSYWVTSRKTDDTGI
jgi:hypothetical protein